MLIQEYVSQPMLLTCPERQRGCTIFLGTTNAVEAGKAFRFLLLLSNNNNSVAVLVCVWINDQSQWLDSNHHSTYGCSI